MGLKNFNFGFHITREDASKTGLFLIFFIVIYLVLTSVFSLIPGVAVQKFVADTELGALGIFGLSGNTSIEETAVINLDAGIGIQISELCTGFQELFILVAAILASNGIVWRRRIIGAIIGAAIVLAFNYIRITATVLIILATADIVLVELAHNILFRVFLFLTIAASYIVWFYWAVQKKATNKTPKNKQNIHNKVLGWPHKKEKKE
ncbi:MAG: archaeosortase/exosortase family protein [Candidatus Diapherotrites archaeon]|nr:archaeosortase/exosortase family protein [Candidatus Diapherotrites archaeon]